MKYHIFGGGTVAHVRPHLALSAPAYGGTARRIEKLLRKRFLLELAGNGVYHKEKTAVNLHLTKMASPDGWMETNQDIELAVDSILADPSPSVVFMSAALCDFEGDTEFGDDSKPPLERYRLKTSEGDQKLFLTPARKIISKIRKERKDIFLVGFKTTTGAHEADMFEAGLNLLKTASCNLVLVNDLHTKLNMIVTPEVAPYDGPNPFDRQLILEELVDMTVARAGLSFTRTRVIEGEHRLKPWRGAPKALQMVVDYCVAKGAYKPFNGVTVGHFGWKQEDMDNGLIFWSSQRKKDFNKEEDRALVKVMVDESVLAYGCVLAYGSKPSAGARSQAQVFKDHPGYDCIVHMHVHLRDNTGGVYPGLDIITQRKQRNLECGSHECGQNTSDGMKEFPEYGVKAVMLEKHGPNILFRSDGDPEKVIDFIRRNFDFDANTSQYL